MTGKKAQKERTLLASGEEPAGSVGSTRPNGEKMDQIRELMFGGTIRDYDRRLREIGERMAADNTRFVEEFESRIAALEEKFGAQIERANAMLRQEGAARTAAIDDVDARILNALRTQRTEFSAIVQQHEDRASSIEAATAQSLAHVEAQIRSVQKSLIEAIAACRVELGADKLAREDLADMMAELSLRLRGGRDDIEND